MLRVSLLALACALSCCPCFGAATTSLLVDDFESNSLGVLPSGWKIAMPITGTSATVVDSFAGRTSKMVKLHDDNGANASDPNKSNTLYRPGAKTAFDRCVFQFDVSLASIHAGFGARITNGDVPTTGTNWCAAIVFEGDIPYNSVGSAPGTLSYQQITTGTGAYTLTTTHYSPETWYTAKIDANFTTKVYKVFFGPRGGTLTEITPSGGVPFIRTTSGGQVANSGGITFFTSNRVSGGVGEPPGDMYIDNVSVTSSIPVAETAASARTTYKNTPIQMVDQVVTAGTDQTNRSFFYIGDDTGGIRVRTSVVARQGDRVSVYGPVQRASDNGTAVLRNGEREINATGGVYVTYGPFPMPHAVGMKNRTIGGAPLYPTPPGPLDTDGYWFQPGVWAKSTGAASGADQISESGTSNVGQYARVWGKVVFADPAHGFFYINDGSNVHDGSALADGSAPPNGVRILAPPGVPLTNIVNRFAVITGIVGSVAQSDAGSPRGPGGNYIRNVRVIRPACEPFLDLNLNGFRDPGEAFIDTNGNGSCDGVSIDGVPGPAFYSAFDRYGTLIVRGSPFMPKGLYCYDVSTGTLDAAKNKGFNVVQHNIEQGEGKVTFTAGDLANFNPRGLKTFPCLRDQTPSTRAAWMALQHDPAIAGWEMYDEPEGYGITPAQVLTDLNWIKGQDPYHIAGNTHFLLDAFASYAGCEEWALSDRYPVGNAALYTVATLLLTARAAHGGSPYWPIYQYVQMFSEAPNFILPTPAQMRAMVYIAAACYTKGYFYFSYQQGGPEWWDCWAQAGTINSEMNTLRSFFTLPFVPVDVTSSNGSVRAGGFRVGGSAIIFTVNTEATDQTTAISLPGIAASTLTLPLEGGAAQTLVNRQFTYTYQPYQVRALLWGNIPPAP